MMKIIKGCNDEDVSKERIVVERTVGGGQSHCVRLGLYSQVTIASDLPAQSSGGETLRKDHFRRSDAYSQLFVTVSLNML